MTIRSPRRFAVRVAIPATALLGLLLVALASHSAADGPPPSSIPAASLAPANTLPIGPQFAEFECRWTDEPITIDGLAGEAAWGAAQQVDRFYLPWLGEKARLAKTPTRAKLLWDRQYLYFCAEMEDVDLAAVVTQHDGPIWNDDCFELFFKPAKGRPGYYEFEVNPANAVLDMFLPSRDSGGYEKYKSDGDFDIKTAVKLSGTLNHKEDRNKGWSVEGRIAWKSLLRTGGRPNPGDLWSFALCRVDASVDSKDQELSTCVALGGSKPNFHRNDDYAPLRFIGPGGVGRPEPAPAAGNPPPAGTLPPLTDSKVVGSPDPPMPYRAVAAYPNLKIPYPIAIAAQPGSDRFLAISEDGPYAPAHLVRFVDDPAASTYEKLLDFAGVAYEIAFHPDFAKNGYVYIGMNTPSNTPKGKQLQTKVVRYTISRQAPYAFDAASAVTVIAWDSNGHNGGAMDFGPDGMLYVSAGDGSSDSDALGGGQDLSRLLSKVLRIDVDHPDAGQQYSVPKDNPFVGVAGARPETWAYGLRNPWRLRFDPKNGDLWVGQNGQDQWEQVYLIQKGANYGWSATEGSQPFYPDRKRGDAPITLPTVEHPHSEARSVTGGLVYYGDVLPALRGTYIYGDYSTGRVWGIRHESGKPIEHTELARTARKITGFGTNSRQELLVLDHGHDGGIYKLEAAPKAADAPPFPQQLSDSGLFKSVQNHVMADGVLAYSVNSPLWSDGASKSRFIAIPSKAGAHGEDRRMTFASRGGFDFPEGTVLVKSFALELAAAKPPGRQWIETRFMTKQDGEWNGYSYAWNADGTDAELVGAAGMDKTFDVGDPANGGGKRQTWHYPSRSECMACHTRASNFVLGLSLLQLNKDQIDGNGHVENQLHAFERLGMLKVDWRGEAMEQVRADGKGLGLVKDELDAYIHRQTAGLDDLPPASSTLLAKPPAEYPYMVNPNDESAKLETRARSYLHANCAICHVSEGGGNSKINLDFTASRRDMGLFDVTPLHEAFGVANPKLAVAGNPDQSVLAHRISMRGPGQMPPLATLLVDEKAVALIRKWIAESDPKAAVE